jgi:hypothetical protein
MMFEGPDGWGSTFIANACVHEGVLASTSYRFGMSVKCTGEQITIPSCSISVENHDTATCSGPPTSTTTQALYLQSRIWGTSSPATITTEQTTAAVNITLRCSGINQIYTDGLIDDVFLVAN